MKSPAAYLLILIGLAVLGSGCDRDEEIVIRPEPKDADRTAPAAGMSAMPGNETAQAAPGTGASAAELGASWSPPAGWQSEGPKQMRAASFMAGETEVIITQFAKDNFGELVPNINRWRGMVTLDPVTDEKQVETKKITVDGHDGTLFDFTGPAKDGPAKRIWVAMIPVGQKIWFFRAQGPATGVEQQRGSMDEFLRSVRFAESDKK